MCESTSEVGSFHLCYFLPCWHNSSRSTSTSVLSHMIQCWLANAFMKETLLLHQHLPCKSLIFFILNFFYASPAFRCVYEAAEEAARGHQHSTRSRYGVQSFSEISSILGAYPPQLHFYFFIFNPI